MMRSYGTPAPPPAHPRIGERPALHVHAEVADRVLTGVETIVSRALLQLQEVLGGRSKLMSASPRSSSARRLPAWGTMRQITRAIAGACAAAAVVAA
jgi:hypothetical protein